MAGDRHSGKLLQGGEFFSKLLGRHSTNDVLLSELCQPCARKVPRHEHELAYVGVVLQGDYLEGDRRLEALPPFTASFNPQGVSHEGVMGPAGVTFFTIEFREAGLREINLQLPQQSTYDRGSGEMLWAALRLYSAFRTKTADPLTIEGHVFEMLGALSASRHASHTAPPWLSRVKERLHEEFCQDLKMRDLANDAGVHPVHLARVFRAVERQTPGAYLQRVRLKAACPLLRNPDYPLAWIAAECGFADQSHFTRVLKRLSGATPAQFRKRLLSHAAAS